MNIERVETGGWRPSSLGMPFNRKNTPSLGSTRSNSAEKKEESVDIQHASFSRAPGRATPHKDSQTTPLIDKNNSCVYDPFGKYQQEFANLVLQNQQNSEFWHSTLEEESFVCELHWFVSYDIRFLLTPLKSFLLAAAKKESFLLSLFLDVFSWILCIK